ncbi:aldo/keto reductase [Alicyclobacillaceae bacterium I2511]|nr:aldo/keto reductase [Alicyclobacillaceae bacterium I2511]
MQHIADTTTLNNGVKMPWLGLGVYKTTEGQEVRQAVSTALAQGYRSIDTAALYGNERGVGEALKASELSRDSVFVTTKVWNSEQGYESTLRAFEDSRQRLGLEFIDLYLIHWPVKGKFKDTWNALEKLYNEGRVRAIGVSNFQIHHLEELLSQAKVVPAVNQVEYHPRLTQEDLRLYCRKHNIQMEAWSPLMRGQVLTHPVVEEISRKYGKTSAQVVLRWELEQQVVTIPKSVHPNRIAENANLFDFALNPQEIAQISNLNENHRVGPNPDDFEF